MTKRRKTISKTHELRLGDMALSRGLDDAGNTMVSWDMVDKCRHEDCPALDQCPYEAAINNGGRCQIMLRYMKAASMTLYNHREQMTSAQRYQVGIHIMPLYRTLCRMKIEEIGVERILYRDDKGMFRINPLYKEIRETIKVIDAVWKSIGVTEVEAPPSKPFSGKNSYYDAMQKDAMGDMT